MLLKRLAGLDVPDPKGHYTHSAAGRNQSPVSAAAVAWPKLSWPKPKPGTKLIFNSFSAETVDVAEIRSVSTIGIGSVFNTLVIIPSELWYIWFTLAHFTFGTPVGTLSVLVVVFGTLGSFLAH